jgi:hypothetical protein
MHAAVLFVNVISGKLKLVKEAVVLINIMPNSQNTLIFAAQQDLSIR